MDYSINDKITICIFTHIVNVDTNPFLKNDMLIRTIKSVKVDLGLIDVKYEIYCDAVMMKNYPELTKEYYDNIRTMIEDAGLSDLDIEIVEETGETLRGNWECAANNVQTPYLMFLEHDWEFIYPLDMKKIINTLDKYEKISYLKFNRFPLDGRPYPSFTHWEKFFETENGFPEAEIPLSKISFFSGYPHIMRVSAIKDFYIPILELNGGKPIGRSHLEKDIKPITERCITEYGNKETHDMWGTYMYGTVPHEPIVRHLGDWCRKN